MDNNRQEKTLCITGGHIAPALAVIEEIQTNKKTWHIVFVGRQETSKGSKHKADEKRLIEDLKIPFFPIHAGRIQRFISWSSIVELCTIPIGLVEASIFCLQNKPDCILSFGGYVGFPMVIAGWLFGIPTIIHEQTHTFGLANKMAAQVASKILATFPDTKGLSKEKQTIVTGLPIRRAFFHPKKNLSIGIPGGIPIVYITGGTTGAASLNELLFPSIKTLVSSFVVIHQTGRQSYEKAMEVKQHLKTEVQERYIPKPYIEADDVAWIMHHMKLLIGRSGANTTAEVALLQKPAVFVPLPWAGNNEQKQNALWYQEQGMVEIVDQQTTTPEKLQETILSILKRLPDTKETKKQIPASRAAASIVDEVASIVSAK